MGLSDEDVREILRIVDESDVDELVIETEGFSLHVRKGAGGDAPSPTAGSPRAVREGAAPPAVPPPAAPPPAAPPPAEAAHEDGVVTVPSPMLGTFYRAEAPGSPPFVEIGARVEADTTICIIEVMKMMNSVPAGVSGTVVEVCPRNGELVEYGEPLLRVRSQ